MIRTDVYYSKRQLLAVVSAVATLRDSLSETDEEAVRSLLSKVLEPLEFGKETQDETV